MSWEIEEIGNLCEVGRGSSPRPINNRAYFDGGDIPWIKIADATNSGKEIIETKEHVNSFGASFSRLLPSGSLILATSGVSLGQVKFLGVEGCIHDGWLYIKNYNGIDKEFLYYKLIELEKHFHSESYGAAIQNINTDILRRTKISLPPLQTQKRIASILSAYDDLIENNLKRIKLLEETAQNIYKEWFVNFRFPNYENTPINQETGLPEGWEKVNLYDFAEVKMGFPFKADDFNEANIGKPAIRIRDIPNNWTKTYTTQEVSEDYTVEQGDILIGMDGFFYLEIWGGQKGYLVQRVCRLRSVQKELQGFLFEALREPIKYYEKTISGATVAHLGAKHLKEIFITVPKGVLIIEQLGVFNKIANQKITLLNQNQKLKEARDILLPRLMNRTIEV